MTKRFITSLIALASLTAFSISDANAAAPYSGGTYIENFDTLGFGSGLLDWTNADVPAVSGAATIPGWNVLQSRPADALDPGRDVGNWDTDYGGFGTIPNGGKYLASAGGNQRLLYSWGQSGNPERSLGTSLASGSSIFNSGDYVSALVLQNTTTDEFGEFTLSFDGEQWYRAGGTVQPQRLVFDFAVYSSAPTLDDIKGDSVAAYMAVPSLDFVSPVNTGFFLGNSQNGNLDANRTAGITDTVGGFSWAPNSYLVLRWWDNNDTGEDHGLGLDNIAFTATAIPEPATAGLAVAGVMMLARRRRR